MDPISVGTYIVKKMDTFFESPCIDKNWIFTTFVIAYIASQFYSYICQDYV